MEVELKDTFSRILCNIINSIAIGLKCNSFREKNAELYVYGEDLGDNSGLRSLKFLINNRKILKLLKIHFWSKKLRDFYTKIIMNNIKIRREEKIKRYDIIHLLLQAQDGMLNDDVDETSFTTEEEVKDFTEKSKRKLELTDEDIVSQIVLFYFASYDTTASASSFLAYELATNPECQKRLIEEIDETDRKCKGNIDYDTLMEMSYLDMVIHGELSNH